MKYCETLEMSLDPAETRSLLTVANRAYNTEVNDLLLTALALAVSRWANLQTVVVNVEGHGRENVPEHIDISRTVGWFTCHFPVVIEIMPGHEEDTGTAVKHVKEALRRLRGQNRGGGIGRGILKYLTRPGKKQGVSFNLEPEICFNYLGQLGQETNSRDIGFTVSHTGTGDPVSPGMENPWTLNINGMVSGEQLCMSFTYNRFEYRRQTMEKLVGLYRSNLVKIIRHCLSKEETEYTPSDISDSAVAEQDVQTVFETLADVFND